MLIITNLNSECLVFEHILRFQDGSVRAFGNEAQDLWAQTYSSLSVFTALLSNFGRTVLCTWNWSCPGNVRIGNSGRNTEIRVLSVTDVSALSSAGRGSLGTGGLTSGPTGRENTAECPSLWVMETPMLDRKPWLNRHWAAGLSL